MPRLRNLIGALLLASALQAPASGAWAETLHLVDPLTPLLVQANPVDRVETAPRQELMRDIVCLSSGVAGSTAAVAAGEIGVATLVAGSMLAPAAVTVATVTLPFVGVVFMAYCWAGRAVAPAAIYIYDRFVRVAPPSGRAPDVPQASG